MIHFVSTPFVHTGESLDTILVEGEYPRRYPTPLEPTPLIPFYVEAYNLTINFGSSAQLFSVSILPFSYFFSCPRVILKTKLTITAPNKATASTEGPYRSSNPPCPLTRILFALQ